MTTLGTSADVRSIEFGGLVVSFDDRVLTPRPWTSRQSLWAADLLQTAPPGPVLEMFCGAGHIGLLAVMEEARGLVQVDVDEVACHYAAANAEAAGIAARVDVRCGGIDEVLEPDAVFAMAIVDPPWVPSGSTVMFPDDPLASIDGGADGLDLARQSLEVVADHLAESGTVLLQLGSPDQARAIREHLEVRPDLRLHVVEVREQIGLGVLARIDRGVSGAGRP